MKKVLSYISVIFFSLLFIMAGFLYCSKHMPASAETPSKTYKAKATEIISDNEIFSKYTNEISERRIVYYAKILNGDKKGEEIVATQVMDLTQMELGSPLKVGSVYFVSEVTNEYMENQWIAGNPVRTPWILFLVLLFVGLIILFGRKKGVSTIISLILTCLSIFLILIPSIICGFNVYFTSILICIFTIISTLLLVSGFTFKTLSASLGCIGGVMIAGIITVLSNRYMNMTGMLDDDSLMIYVMNPDKPIDLRALLFAGIIIGAVGAVMDVGMSIASSLTEITEKIPDISFKELVKSGFSIGRDIMGTMANTLVLAYIGSGLHMTVLLLNYKGNLEEILNMEMIASEILQAMAGSIAILFTIPTTTLFTAFLHKRKDA